MRFSLVVFFLQCLTLPLFASIGDSLEYVRQKNIFLSSTEFDSNALATADLLASEQLFSEATTLLRVMAKNDTAIFYPKNYQTNNAKSGWNVSFGTAIYQLDDIDTTTLSTEELRDYKRLTETPILFWTRTKKKMNIKNKLFTNIIPELYLSTERATLELAGKRESFKEIVDIDFVLRSEKRYPIQTKNRSDMISCLLSVTPSALLFPVSAELVKYRSNRDGYESLNRFSFSPSIEKRRISQNIYGGIEAVVAYEDYTPQYDSMDLIVGRVFADLAIAKGIANVSTAATVLYEKNIGQTNRLSFFRAEPVAKVDMQINERVLSKSTLKIDVDIEEFNNHSIQDSKFSIKHMLDIIATPWLTVGSGGLLEKQYFTLEGKYAIEPLIYTNIVFSKIDWSLSSSYRQEIVEEKFKSATIDDNFSISLENQLFLSLSRAASFSALADYQFKCYKNGRKTENIAISGQFTLQF